jgi:hypothetical protein
VNHARRDLCGGTQQWVSLPRKEPVVPYLDAEAWPRNLARCGLVQKGA